MDWDDKLTSIVQETELNLNRIKDRLDSAKLHTQTELKMSQESAFKPYSSNFQGGIKPFTSMPNYPAIHKPLPNTTVQTRSPNNGILSSQQPVQDSSLAILLSERIDSQNQEIDKLYRSVRRLEQEKDQHKQDMDNLKDEMRTLNRRLSEKGVDLETEKKLDRWKRETDMEINQLQSQLSRCRNNEEQKLFGEGQFASMSREIQDMRRFSQEECDSLRRELETLKSRLVRVELELASIATDNKDLSRRNERIEKTLREPNHSHSYSPVKPYCTQSSISKDTMYVNELHRSIRALQDKIKNLECSVEKSVPFDSVNLKKYSKISELSNRNRYPKSNKITGNTQILDEVTGISDEEDYDHISFSTDIADYDSVDLNVTSPKDKNYCKGLEEELLESLDLSETESLASDLLTGKDI